MFNDKCHIVSLPSGVFSSFVTITGLRQISLSPWSLCRALLFLLSVCSIDESEQPAGSLCRCDDCCSARTFVCVWAMTCSLIQHCVHNYTDYRTVAWSVTRHTCAHTFCRCGLHFDSQTEKGDLSCCLSRVFPQKKSTQGQKRHHCAWRQIKGESSYRVTFSTDEDEFSCFHVSNHSEHH